MPQTIIERAARAMYANVGPDWSWDDPDAEGMRHLYRENVRVALAALREPTEAMLAAGTSVDPALRYRAMIDAALAE